MLLWVACRSAVSGRVECKRSRARGARAARVLKCTRLQVTTLLRRVRVWNVLLRIIRE